MSQHNPLAKRFSAALDAASDWLIPSDDQHPNLRGAGEHKEPASPPPASPSPAQDSELRAAPMGAPLRKSPSTFVPRVFQECYDLGAKLGSGAYADVYECISKTTQVVFAVKLINKAGMDDFVATAFKEEMRLLRKLSHNNIVPLYDFLEDSHRYYVIMQNMQGGELLQRLVKRSQFSERDARDVMRQVLRALDYCHDHDIVHRDLKPENLLLTDLTETATLKIADFGLAIQSSQQQSTLCGTPNYIAPEVLNEQPYGKPVDVWACGVIIYLLLCGSLPFKGRSRREKFENVKAGAFEFSEEHTAECHSGGDDATCQSWAHLSQHSRDVVSACLQLDPQARPTVKQLLEHEWMQRPLSEAGSTRSLVHLKSFNARSKWKTALQLVRLGVVATEEAPAAPAEGDVDSDADDDLSSSSSDVRPFDPNSSSFNSSSSSFGAAAVAPPAAPAAPAAPPAEGVKRKDSCAVQ